MNLLFIAVNRSRNSRHTGVEGIQGPRLMVFYFHPFSPLINSRSLGRTSFHLTSEENPQSPPSPHHPPDGPGPSPAASEGRSGSNNNGALLWE